jgi:hypothetical protein
MTSPAEQDQIRAEIEFIMHGHGIPAGADESDLPVADVVMLREIARRVIHGDMDREQLSSLTPEMSAALDSMVRHLIALKSSTSVRQLEELNPYYSAFQPKVVRDGVKKAHSEK